MTCVLTKKFEKLNPNYGNTYIKGQLSDHMTPIDYRCMYMYTKKKKKQMYVYILILPHTPNMRSCVRTSYAINSFQFFIKKSF